MSSSLTTQAPETLNNALTSKNIDLSTSMIPINTTEKKTIKPKNKPHHQHTSAKLKRPGKLKTDITLTLHTTEAQLFLLGYAKAPKLIHFSTRMSQIQRAANQDDPYADHYLVTTYHQLTTLKKALIVAIQSAEQQLVRYRHTQQVKIKHSHSDTPFTTSLFFNNPYGYLATNIIALFDRLLCLLLTLKRIGAVVNETVMLERQQWSKRIASAFNYPFQWKNFNIKRADVIQLTKAAQRAQQRMGDLSETLLKKHSRSPFSTQEIIEKA